jgi:formylmethanofuran dehydrogenase subunit A
MGQIIFTETTTMTADGPFQFILYELSGNKWVNSDVETETSAGIVPFQYKRKSFVHAMQWSIAMELALLIQDPWKIFLTTDHPNAGPFTHYPRVISWLISRKAREKILERINRKAQRKSLVPTIDREYSLYEIAVITRAGQSKALGLKNKGHLGVGADADIAIYNLNPETLDLAQKPKTVRKAFERAAYTIKDGNITVKNGEVVSTPSGRTFWVNVEAPQAEIEISKKLQQKFGEYYTVKYENYPVPEHYLAIPASINVKAEVQ